MPGAVDNPKTLIDVVALSIPFDPVDPESRVALPRGGVSPHGGDGLVHVTGGVGVALEGQADARGEGRPVPRSSGRGSGRTSRGWIPTGGDVVG